MTRFDCGGISPDSLASSGALDAAADFFIREGYVILDHVLPRDRVEALHREFLADYAGSLKDERGEQSQRVGQRRYMIAMRFAGGFADPGVFANPYVVALARRVLEASAILESYGCFVSLPGAETQHRHHDGPHLFGTRLSAMLPPYALTCGIPLVEMNEVQGSTMLVPGSHRWVEPRPDAPTLLPVVPPGSCALWDYRLRHFGTANRSSTARPMVYCTYARPWYRDPVNFQEAPEMRRLDLTAAFVESLPEDLRGLLLHARRAAAGDRPA